ncbi:sugar phosphate isomerase/epimerase [Sporomusaceae bacterium BoRhaA]|uniref:sugar phosphate isomerase/epimerase family protein n=1 Tax=Pelorhabdus rhamnosifermentans TaxID=2772457 RepID=UPI001C06176E|nr:sugar phosphate isomerase/epimerase family protein [Pelorhabdus rhamnosifermentans]MBU2699652.1 sugar phosphate isomerase/epimerase [Pelorhabdus rhamnosifermentans]
MQLALSNLSFIGFESNQLINLPKDLGLEIFYEFGNDLYWHTLLKQLFSDHAPHSLSLHGPCIATNLADPNDNHYLVQYKQALDFAAKWQANFIVVHTNEAFTGDKRSTQNLVKDRITELVALANNYPVQLVIENVGLCNKNTLLFDWNDYWDLIQAFPTVGALLDTGHAHINGWQMPRVIYDLGPRLKACHLHDNHGQTDAHLPIGLGIIPWQSLFTALQTSCPDASLIFEYAHVELKTALANIQTITKKYSIEY